MQSYFYSTIFESETRNNRKLFTVEDRNGNKAIAALIHFPERGAGAESGDNWVETWIKLPEEHVAEYLHVWSIDGDFDPTRRMVTETDELYSITLLGKYLKDIADVFPESHPNRLENGFGLNKHVDPYSTWFYTDETKRALEAQYLAIMLEIDQAKFDLVLPDMVKPDELTPPRKFQVKSVHTVKDSRGYILYQLPDLFPGRGRSGNDREERLSGYIYDAERGEITYTTVDAWRYKEVHHQA